MRHLKTLIGVDASRSNPRSNPSPKQFVQLAGKYTGYPAGVPYVIVEPKIDGWRLAAFIKDGKVTFSTRQGNTQPMTQNLAFIGDQLLRMGFKKGMVDGEIIVDGNWNATAMIRKDNPTAAERQKIEQSAVYCVFDYTDEQQHLTQIERTTRVHKLVGRGSKNVRALPSWKCTNDTQVREVFDRMIKEGYEGVIVKSPTAVYVQRRTNNWMKIKEFATQDAKIVGFVEGKGRLAGTLGYFVATLRNGKQVKVGSGPSDKLRNQVWANKKAFLGKWIEVKMQKSAAHPTATFVRMREDIIVKEPKAAKRAKAPEAPKRQRVARRAAITQPGLGKIVSPDAVHRAVIQMGLRFSPDDPVVRIGAAVAHLVNARTWQVATFDARSGQYKYRKATANEKEIVRRTLGKQKPRKSTKAAVAPARHVEITAAEIRRKYLSCIEKVLPNAGNRAYAICAMTLHKKYGRDAVEAALVPVRKQAAKDAAATRAAKKARGNPRGVKSRNWEIWDRH